MVRDKASRLVHGSCLLRVVIHIWTTQTSSFLNYLIWQLAVIALHLWMHVSWLQCSVLALPFMNLFKIYCHWLFCDYSCKEWKISGLHQRCNRLIKEFLALLIVDIQVCLVSFSWLFSAFMLHLAQLIPIYRGIQKKEVTGSHHCEEWRL